MAISRVASAGLVAAGDMITVPEVRVASQTTCVSPDADGPTMAGTPNCVGQKRGRCDCCVGPGQRVVFAVGCDVAEDDPDLTSLEAARPADLLHRQPNRFLSNEMSCGRVVHEAANDNRVPVEIGMREEIIGVRCAAAAVGHLCGFAKTLRVARRAKSERATAFRVTLARLVLELASESSRRSRTTKSAPASQIAEVSRNLETPSNLHLPPARKRHEARGRGGSAC